MPRLQLRFLDYPEDALCLRAYLAAIAIFCNEVKGKCALALSRDLGVSYKCAFVLAHKLREAIAEEMKGRTLAEGKVVEVDGGYFVKPRDLAENRVDRRLARNRTASARSSSSCGSATATPSAPYSALRVRGYGDRPANALIRKDQRAPARSGGEKSDPGRVSVTARPSPGRLIRS